MQSGGVLVYYSYMTGSTPLGELKGIGEQSAKLFAKLGVRTVADLVDNYPRTYEDYSSQTTINQLKPGSVTVAATINNAKGRYVRRGMHITEAIASDETGSVRLIWFNQPYRANAIKSGETYFISGDYALRRGRLSLLNPSIELASDFPVNTARIIPIYRETKGLASRIIRKQIAALRGYISDLPETLPQSVIDSQNLLSRSEAIMGIHFPSDADELEAARARLGFEEVFRLSLASLLNKQENQTELADSIAFAEQVAKQFVEALPFTLTDGQRAAAWSIYQDMQKPQAMNRLLEGDVGSGKTVVATMAAVMALHSGKQVAFMAPTELLARQHADTVFKLLKAVKMEDQCSLLVGSMKPTQKRSVHQALKEGTCRFVIGTHALFQDAVAMDDLALIIVDEQHRFGVEQRKALMAKAGKMPHVLSMTATPIPRSLALTLYGELDISILNEKPKGRLEIITELIPPSSRPKLYDSLETQLNEGRQIFIVCPLISESDSMEARSAEKVYDELSKGRFKKWRIGLLHGQRHADDKTNVMQQFVDHELDILVATTVIEVGVDVPNATVMLIESPERFGLAQIHQLRGRVGRSDIQSYCYLMLSDAQTPSQRLKALERTNDGFKLAELDLKLRGPGAIYGTMQHGALDLRIAKLTDTHMIAAARAAAQQCLDDQINLLHYKELYAHVKRLRTVTNLN